MIKYKAVATVVCDYCGVKIRPEFTYQPEDDIISELKNTAVTEIITTEEQFCDKECKEEKRLEDATTTMKLQERGSR